VAIIDVSSLTLVATVTTLGEYDNAGLSNWNGQPLSDSNKPTAEQDQLSATWNFYVDPSATNTLYVVVNNVTDTQFAYIIYSPINLVPLTGFQFSLDVETSSYASFSNQFAMPTEALLGPVSGSSTPLETTPGWIMLTASGAPDHVMYQIETPTVSYAFTHFPSVSGATRIFGGGVFQFTFDPSVNLLHTNFNTLTATATNGEGSYTEIGTLHIVPPAMPPAPSDASVVNGYVNAAYDTALQMLTGTAENGSTVGLRQQYSGWHHDCGCDQRVLELPYRYACR
jgi:hypothetical protein